MGNLFALLGCVLLFAPNLYARSFDTFGDSITAGVLNKTNVTKAPPLNIYNRMVTDLFNYHLYKDTKYLAPYQDEKLGWPGLLAESMADKGEKIPVFNYAVPGAMTHQLLPQVRRSIQRKTQSQLAFFLIGHNDLCHNYVSVEETAKKYYQQFDSAIQVWDKNHKHARAVFVGIGEIHELYPVLYDYVWKKTSKQNLTCHYSWKSVFRYCPRFVRLYEKGELRKFLAPRIAAMNKTLGKLATDWNRKTKNGNRFDSIPETSTFKLRPEYFALDCFHLSSEGHKLLANLIEEKL